MVNFCSIFALAVFGALLDPYECFSQSCEKEYAVTQKICEALRLTQRPSARTCASLKIELLTVP